MTWFNIVKGAKEDAETYWKDFTGAIDSWFHSVLKELYSYIKELSEPSESELLAENIGELERQILQPILDMVKNQRAEVREQTLERIGLVKDLQKKARNIIAEVQDAPIEIKIQTLAESFTDTYEDADPKFIPPRVDREKIDDIIHRLGFEGKGME